MLRADSLEARADAAGALALMQSKPLGPDGRPWWRPARLRRLEQLVMLGDDVPDWVVGRWIVAQAAQNASSADRRTLDRAVEVRGGRCTLWGVDDDDAACKVLDHDWVFRQLALHDQGGLAGFLQDTASAELTARCPGIEAWAGAGMGGYVCMGAFSDEILWLDLSNRAMVRTVNLGGANLLGDYDAVIGRIVSADAVNIFESPPLVVPLSVARDVAKAPGTWLELLHAACRGPHGDNLTFQIARMHEFDMLFDLPTRVRRALVTPGDEGLQADSVGSGGNGLEYDVALVLAALGGDLEVECDDACCPECTETCGGRCYGQCCDDCPEGWSSLWPLVGAALLEPGTSAALSRLLGPGDVAALAHASGQLATPAATVASRLMEEVERAAS